MEEAPKKNNMLVGFHIKKQDESGLVLHTANYVQMVYPESFTRLGYSKRRYCVGTQWIKTK
ncbi:hypothetical protein [Bacillus sp. CECT 9360]|uniref:hypothetical protein n=1 Tax=Bacillus sp. CECT 9360 TaxID=2845821 RepID=UPI001E51BCF9|nr:hypothetical protein [Bacillus sp. CECT 9360]CAH0344150.1 hypothetical protein BCI9360_00381 [Bacillus sp. CECT 9360]